MNSGSSIADALISHLAAVSACNFDSASQSGNISKNDFGLLDTTTSGCVWMILPPSFESDPDVFGNPVEEDSEYQITIRSFVREQNNSVATLNQVYQAERDLRQAMKANSDLSGSISWIATLVRGTGWNGNDFVESGQGMVYLPQDFVVKVSVQE